MPLEWSLDVSSFLVLLSESEELSFRRAKKRLPDVLSLAPVSGLQAYLRSYNTLIDVEDRYYVSPYGRKTAPLRNIRVAQMIEKRSMLADGQVRTYEIQDLPSPNRACRWAAIASWSIALFSWIVFAVLVFAAFWTSCTWIGKSNLFAFAGWSVYLRGLDAISFVPAQNKSTDPQDPDAVIFLGRRNSAFILKGSRQDIGRWTGLGLRCRPSSEKRPYLKCLQAVARAGTFVLLGYMFATIPNGTTLDQVIFIAYNVFGQLNTWLGIYVHAYRTLLTLHHVSDMPAETRTHVWAAMIRDFRDQEDWIDAADELPNTPIWDEWKRKVAQDLYTDPKTLYNEISKKKKKSMPTPMPTPTP
ncbi:hypothetical protein GGR57DRAFT_468485 [Xylariaceae sp. FL1272]|nr:hypothetical protein GGR57DRAFT_468485 [Xylariaceae sp. FL1272]